MALVAAGLLTAVAAFRPLAPGAAPWTRLGVSLAIGLGVVATAFLASLKGRGRAEQLSFYAFLVLAVDAVGQLLSPFGWPIGPLIALLVAAVTIAEGLMVALGIAGWSASSRPRTPPRCLEWAGGPRPLPARDTACSSSP